MWRKAYQRADFIKTYSGHTECSIFSNINEGKSKFLLLVSVQSTYKTNMHSGEIAIWSPWSFLYCLVQVLFLKPWNSKGFLTLQNLKFQWRKCLDVNLHKNTSDACLHEIVGIVSKTISFPWGCKPNIGVLLLNRKSWCLRPLNLISGSQRMHWTIQIVQWQQLSQPGEL